MVGWASQRAKAQGVKRHACRASERNLAATRIAISRRIILKSSFSIPLAPTFNHPPSHGEL